MTVGAGSVVRGPFLPDGRITNWPFPFTARLDSEVVPRLVTPTGSFIPQHTVVRNNAEDRAGEGGHIVISPPIEPGAGELWISYLPSMDQEVVFEDQARFSPAVMNGALDLAASRDQYLDARLDRAQKVRLGELGPAIPPRAVRADTLRAWSPDGGDERTDITVAAWFGALRAIAALQDAVKGLQAQVAALFGMISRLVGGAGGGASGLDLSLYLSPAQQVTDLGTGPSGWTDVSEQLRQAFSDAADLGVHVDASRCRGMYYIDPATPILVRRGCGFVGPQVSLPVLGYVNVDGLLKDSLDSDGLDFIVDPLSAHRKVPKFALQGNVLIDGLSIVGVGMVGIANTIKVKETIVVDGEPKVVDIYPKVTGADEFFTDAPVIVTDHQHNPDGALVGPGEKLKAGNITLRCSLLGVMQGVCIGDVRPDEEPWALATSSGIVNGTGGNDIEINCGPMLRPLIVCRKTSGGMKIAVNLVQPRWTGVTQPMSGGKSDNSIIKLVQQHGRGLHMWHRAVGFDIKLRVRGLRYGVYMEAGYSPAGPTYDAPQINTAVSPGHVISGADTNVFVATAAGAYTTKPVASGANYEPDTGVFSDPGSTLCWRYVCRKQDTGKYNNGEMAIEGERNITPIYVHDNAYMHNVRATINGHLMDFYNMRAENAPAIDVRSHRLIAGAVDKHLADPWVEGRTYGLDDTIADATGLVWGCTHPGLARLAPNLADAVDGVFTDGALKWLYSDEGTWEPDKYYVLDDKISDGQGNIWACKSPGTSHTPPTKAAATDPDTGEFNGVFKDGELEWRYRNDGWKAFGDDPFARNVVTGVIAEISGPLFKNTPYDGHQSWHFDTMSIANWSQAQSHKGEALIQNLSPATSVKHGGSQCYAVGRSNRIYDVVDEGRLHVGFNDYYGYAPDGETTYPEGLRGSLSDGFFDGKNCMVHRFDPAVAEEDEPGDD